MYMPAELHYAGTIIAEQLAMQPTHSFDPIEVSFLGAILTEIETEFAGKGLTLDDAMRELIAHKIMEIASRGVSERAAIKSYALSSP
jgi:hypothetical protein